MKKKTIITALLVLIAMAGQAKTYKTIKNPVAMAHTIYGGELKAREVIFRDTATTVHFTIDYPKGQWFSINSTSFLTDEEGNEEQFEILGSIELDGKVYYAMTSVEEKSDEYVILRLEGEDGDDVTLVTIDDDDEFDRVADEFEDKLFGEIDYDADGSEEQ